MYVIEKQIEEKFHSLIVSDCPYMLLESVYGFAICLSLFASQLL
jgi:hypothetical protein